MPDIPSREEPTSAQRAGGSCAGAMASGFMWDHEKKRRGRGGGRGSASSAEPAKGGILVIRIDEPGSAAPGPCGRRGGVQIVRESHRSPGEVEPGDRGDSARDLED